MLHTKTEPGYYSEKDYWTVSWTDSSNGEKIEKKYGDIDNAYEDFCYYKKHGYRDIEYKHHRKE